MNQTRKDVLTLLRDLHAQTISGEFTAAHAEQLAQDLRAAKARLEPIKSTPIRHTEELDTPLSQRINLPTSMKGGEFDRFLEKWQILLVGELLQYVLRTTTRSRYSSTARSVLRALLPESAWEVAFQEWVPPYANDPNVIGETQKPIPLYGTLNTRKSWIRDSDNLVQRYRATRWGRLIQCLTHGHLRDGTIASHLINHLPINLRIGMVIPEAWSAPLHTQPLSNGLKARHARAKKAMQSGTIRTDLLDEVWRSWYGPKPRLYKHLLIDLLFCSYDLQQIPRFKGKPDIPKGIQALNEAIFREYGLVLNPDAKTVRAVLGDTLPADWVHPLER